MTTEETLNEKIKRLNEAMKDMAASIRIAHTACENALEIINQEREKNAKEMEAWPR